MIEFKVVGKERNVWEGPRSSSDEERIMEWVIEGCFGGEQYGPRKNEI